MHDGSRRRAVPSRTAGLLSHMWTDTYGPATVEDVLIRKNKVEEMMEWMKAKGDPVCVLSGPAGCGKSTLVRVVADACGREIVEYAGQVQIDRSSLYKDVYESKLEAYESFCGRAWMPTFATSETVVVLDDVPIAVGEGQMERLVRATLRLLSRSRKTLIVCTEVSSKDSSEHQGYTRWEESSIPKALIQAIDMACHPTTISLNPIPKATMVKHLCMIAKKENIAIAKSDVQDIAEQSLGDLSHALLTLQFTARGATTHAVSHRDSSLSLFHGLGKLLYNKRVDQSTSGEYARAPMDGFQPEETVHASGLSGPSVTAFLHENILSFVDDEYIDDISQCLEEISFSDVVSCHRDATPYYGLDDPDAARGMSDLIASMISSRGICFWNSHPAPRTWKPLKAPQAFKVEHARRTNVQRLQKAAAVNRIVYGGSLDETTFESMATEMLPYLRTFHPWHVYQQPQEWDRYWQGTVHQATRVWHDQQGMSVVHTSPLDDVDIMEDPIE